jgi:oligoendopeptidase F
MSLKIILILLIGSLTMAQTNYESREEVPEKYKWDLSPIYSSWDEWENGLKEMEAKMETITSFKGKLKEDVKNLFVP